MILRAKYLLINPETIIEDGFVAIKGHLISKVGRFTTQLRTLNSRLTDLGNALIMPGLVNPHTHLEGPETYGGKNPKGEPPWYPPQSFPNWAERVINFRLQMKPSDFLRSVTDGYRRLARNGITTVGDHSHLGRTWRAHKKSLLRTIILEEFVNLNPRTAEITFQKVADFLKIIPKKNRLISGGVAPHAPYTVSDKLYRLSFKFAQNNKMPLSTHLSELREEVQLLITGKGPLKDYLKRVGRDNPYWQPPGISPVQYLYKLGALKRPAFFVHCNYLSQTDIDLLARTNSTVVFCPNSQHYFGHPPHPFRRLIKAGVNVALGTDGLGSNQDLSILKEMRFVLEHYTGISPRELIRMGTLNGLKAIFPYGPTPMSPLRRPADEVWNIGILKPGYEADIAVFPLIKKIVRKEDVLEHLIETAPESRLTMVAGKTVRS